MAWSQLLSPTRFAHRHIRHQLPVAHHGYLSTSGENPLAHNLTQDLAGNPSYPISKINSRPSNHAMPPQTRPR